MVPPKPKTPTGPPTNGWSEWSNHVLLELERLSECYMSLDEKWKDLHTDFKVFKKEMQIKAGIWGLIGGAIPIIVIVGVIVIRKVLTP